MLLLLLLIVVKGRRWAPVQCNECLVVVCLVPYRYSLIRRSVYTEMNSNDRDETLFLHVCRLSYCSSVQPLLTAISLAPSDGPCCTRFNVDPAGVNEKEWPIRSANFNVQRSLYIQSKWT